MSEVNFLKNPVLRNKAAMDMVDPSGSALEEINDAVVTGGISTWDIVVSTVVCVGASAVLGNKGKLCTATVECMNNCS